MFDYLMVSNTVDTSHLTSISMAISGIPNGGTQPSSLFCLFFRPKLQGISPENLAKKLLDSAVPILDSAVPIDYV